MSNRQLVISVYPDELAADKAAASLKNSGLTVGDAMGILALDGKGHLKQDKIGARSSGKGVGVGSVLVLLGPVGVVAGVAGGAAVGALHHKGLGLDDADKARLTGELQSGKAAVGVLAKFEDAPRISERLEELGGTSESHLVTDEGLDEAAKADTPE